MKHYNTLNIISNKCQVNVKFLDLHVMQTLSTSPTQYVYSHQPKMNRQFSMKYVFRTTPPFGRNKWR